VLDSSQALVRAADLTWVEYRARIEADPIVLLPVGALEQHGQHLPLETDTRIAVTLAELVASRTAGLVLPPIAYGARSLPRSGGGSTFPGTVDLDGATITSLVRDVIREQARHGVTRFVVLLGHGENDPYTIEGAVLAQRELAGRGMQVVVIGWWHVLEPADVAPLFPDGFPGWDLEHAARIETSLMLALAPATVRHDQIGPVDAVAPPPFTMIPSPASAVPSQGSLADPRGASAAFGQQLAAVIVDRLVDLLGQHFDAAKKEERSGGRPIP
jgi:creatinine amidohydrolase